MTKRPTPETNAVLARLVKNQTGNSCDAVVIHHARKLERERDEAREDLRLFKHDKKHLCDSHRDKRGNCMVCSMEEAK